MFLYSVSLTPAICMHESTGKETMKGFIVEGWCAVVMHQHRHRGHFSALVAAGAAAAAALTDHQLDSGVMCWLQANMVACFHLLLLLLLLSGVCWKNYGLLCSSLCQMRRTKSNRAYPQPCPLLSFPLLEQKRDFYFGFIGGFLTAQEHIAVSWTLLKIDFQFLFSWRKFLRLL